MKLNKDIRIRILYIFVLYIIYSFLLDKYDYVAKYLIYIWTVGFLCRTF